MKPKKLEKKLVLNKTTVSNLNSDDMLTLRAGALAASEKTDLCQSVCNSACVNCYSVNYTCVGMHTCQAIV